MPQPAALLGAKRTFSSHDMGIGNGVAKRQMLGVDTDAVPATPLSRPPPAASVAKTPNPQKVAERQVMIFAAAAECEIDLVSHYRAVGEGTDGRCLTLRQ